MAMNSEPGWSGFDSGSVDLTRETDFLETCTSLILHAQVEPVLPGEIESEVEKLNQEFLEFAQADIFFEVVRNLSLIPPEQAVRYLRTRVQNGVRIVTMLIKADEFVGAEDSYTIDSILAYFTQILCSIYFGQYWEEVEISAFIGITEEDIFDLFRKCGEVSYELAVDIERNDHLNPVDRATEKLFKIAHMSLKIAAELLKKTPLSGEVEFEHLFRSQSIQEIAIVSNYCYVRSLGADINTRAARFKFILSVCEELLSDIMKSVPFESQVKSLLTARTHYNAAAAAHYGFHSEAAIIHAQASIDYFCFIYPEVREVLSILRPGASTSLKTRMSPDDISKVEFMMEILDTPPSTGGEKVKVTA